MNLNFSPNLNLLFGMPVYGLLFCLGWLFISNRLSKSEASAEQLGRQTLTLGHAVIDKALGVPETLWKPSSLSVWVAASFVAPTQARPNSLIKEAGSCSKAEQNL